MSRGADVGWMAWWWLEFGMLVGWLMCICGVLVSEIARCRLGCVSTLGSWLTPGLVYA